MNATSEHAVIAKTARKRRAPFEYTVVFESNPFHPGVGRDVRVLRKRQTLQQLAPKTDLPFICFLNGMSVLRAEWSTTKPRHEDIVVFKTLVRGGQGGKNPLSIIASLVLMVVAPYLAPALAGAMGISTVLARALISITGSMLINAVFGSKKPDAPAYNGMAEQAAPSPVYSLQGQGNVSRLGNVIPAAYGRMKLFPNLGAVPYSEYQDNDQYVRQLFCLGQGYYDIEALYLEDTALSVLEDVQYQVIEPGGTVTLFPTDVVTAAEVAGQELLKEGDWMGPFTINPAGTQANRIAVDMVFPSGLLWVTNEGGFTNKTIDWQLNYRKINDAGAPIGDWVNPSGQSSNRVDVTIEETHAATIPGADPYTIVVPHPEVASTVRVELFDLDEAAWILLHESDNGSTSRNNYYRTGGTYFFSVHRAGRDVRITYNYRTTNVVYGDFAESFTAATNTPQRRSYYYPVPLGRYEVRMRRLDVKDTNTRAAHTLMWNAARAYLPGTQQYGNVTMIALSMKATNQLSELATRRFNAIATRRLPTWTSGGGWTAPVATRSIAWALADIIKAQYGGQRLDAHFDLAGLYALDAIWTTRGDHFDGVFDNRSTLWEALSIAARAGRSKPFIQGGMIRFARDQAAVTPVAMFSYRNMKEGSFETEYLLPGDDSPDSVDVRFHNAAIWKEDRVSAILTTHDRPADFLLFGVTDHDHAWREGIYEVAANRYRRRPMKFTTEMEGFIPSPMDLIAIARDRPIFGQTAEIVSYNTGSATIVASTEFTWAPAGQHYIALRKRDGSLAGPYAVSQGATANVLIVAGTFPSPTIPLDVQGGAREATHIAFGLGEAHRMLARVVALTPRGLHEVDVTCVNENDLVHSADGTAPPPPPTRWNLVPSVQRPVISELRVVMQESFTEPQIILQWSPVSGVSAYIVQHSTDNSEWHTLIETSDTRFIIRAVRGLNYVRIAAVGLVRGPWKSWSGAFADYTEHRPPPPGDTTVLPPGRHYPPVVTGLELFGQGLGSTVFGGRTPKFWWRRQSTAGAFELGNEPFGAGDGVIDPDFLDYEVTISNGVTGTLLRAEHTQDNFYEYSYEDNFADTSGLPCRDLLVQVWQRTRFGLKSQFPATLRVTNPQSTLPLGMSVRAHFKNVILDYTPPNDADWRGLLVWMSQTPGFTPSGLVGGTGNCVYKGIGETVIWLDALPATNYYVRFATWDIFGTDSLTVSAEYPVSTLQIFTADIAPAAVITSKIADLAVDLAKLADNSVSTAKILDDAVTAVELADLAVSTAHVQVGAITETLLANLAVSTGKVQIGAITETLLGALSISTGKIQVSAITNSLIAANAVNATSIASDAVTSPKILAGAVIAGKIATNAVTANEILAGSIITAKLGALAVTAAEIAAGAIITSKIQASAVTATEIASNAITTAKLNANVITANEILAGAVTTAKIAANAVTANEIAAATITATQIASDAITTAKIQAAAVTAAKISVSQLSAITADLGSITAGSINIGSSKFVVDSSGNVTIQNAASGARLEIKNNVIKVYDSGGVLRVRLGDLTA